jgi:multidrug efflux pump subunit AcrB
MWIVRLALRRPYTFVVVAILILIMGTLAIVRTPTDIFPSINIPVISIIWTYNGLVPEDMAESSVRREFRQAVKFEWRNRSFMRYRSTAICPPLD